MQGIQGSVTQLDQVGPSSAQNDAASNAANEQSLRIQHSDPTVFDRPHLPTAVDQGRYNTAAALPAKYSTPSEFKDHLNVKNEMIGAFNDMGTEVQRTAPITEQEIDYVRQSKAEKDLEAFDAYVNTLIDPRKPGNLQWLLEVYPDFVYRRVKQIHDDHQYALKNSLIDGLGLNTFEDLFFKYNVDQGIIKGPMLRRTRFASDSYTPGSMSFLNANAAADRAALPYNSATYGNRPADSSGLAMPHRTAGSMQNLIRSLWRPGDSTTAGIRTGAANPLERRDIQEGFNRMSADQGNPAVGRVRANARAVGMDNAGRENRLF